MFTNVVAPQPCARTRKQIGVHGQVVSVLAYHTSERASQYSHTVHSLRDNYQESRNVIQLTYINTFRFRAKKKTTHFSCPLGTREVRTNAPLAVIATAVLYSTLSCNTGSEYSSFSRSTMRHSQSSDWCQCANTRASDRVCPRSLRGLLFIIYDRLNKNLMNKHLGQILSVL